MSLLFFILVFFGLVCTFFCCSCVCDWLKHRETCLTEKRHIQYLQEQERLKQEQERRKALTELREAYKKGFDIDLSKLSNEDACKVVVVHGLLALGALMMLEMLN